MRKDRLLAWAEDQDLDPTGSYILYRLAQYADADGCAWAKVETLSKSCKCSERTVQYRLRAMEEAGMIALTERTYRLGTRSVPIYQLAPDEAEDEPSRAPGEASSMGANPAPMEGCEAPDLHPYGCNCLHPHKEPKRTYEDASASSAGAREGGGAGAEDEAGRSGSGRVSEAAFDRVATAWMGLNPDRVARPRAWVAWRRAAAGLDDGPAALERAAMRWIAESADAKARKIPALDRWLADEKYLGWLGEAAVAGVAAAGPAARFGDEAVRAALVEIGGEPWVATWIDRHCGWDGGRRALLVAGETARARIAGMLTPRTLETLNLRLERTPSPS